MSLEFRATAGQESNVTAVRTVLEQSRQGSIVWTLFKAIFSRCGNCGELLSLSLWILPVEYTFSGIFYKLKDIHRVWLKLKQEKLCNYGSRIRKELGSHDSISLNYFFIHRCLKACSWYCISGKMFKLHRNIQSSKSKKDVLWK